jgi:hypothetical protein
MKTVEITGFSRRITLLRGKGGVWCFGHNSDSK